MLETLLEEARSGKVLGLTIVVFERDRKISLGITGVANIDPVSHWGRSLCCSKSFIGRLSRSIKTTLPNGRA